MYNNTKGGVDTFDQMVRNYSCQRKTRRWPNVLFYNIIDIIALNCLIIESKLNPNYSDRDSGRSKFLLDLSKSLIDLQYQSKESNGAKNLNIAPKEAVV